ncbi:MAG: hypothetical protein NZ959_12340 [Armatimonadetes bacterium]|nr:hypothetical protein [Armatimonadota bacterium]MDW8123126.1 hypothetical protein [Armatimonadota bacterium]
MKCSVCNAENQEGQIYCWKCFAPLTKVSEETPAAAEEKPTKSAPPPIAPPMRPVALATSEPRRLVVLPLLIVMVLLVVLGAGGVLIISQQGSPDKMAMEFMTALFLKPDAAVAERLVVSGQKEKVAGLVKGTEQGFKIAQQMGFGDLSQMLKLSVKSTEQKGSEAIVRIGFQLSASQNPAFSYSFDLPVVIVRERLLFWKVDLDRTVKAWEESVQTMMKTMPVPGLPGLRR